MRGHHEPVVSVTPSSPPFLYSHLLSSSSPLSLLQSGDQGLSSLGLHCSRRFSVHRFGGGCNFGDGQSSSPLTLTDIRLGATRTDFRVVASVIKVVALQKNNQSSLVGHQAYEGLDL